MIFFSVRIFRRTQRNWDFIKTICTQSKLNFLHNISVLNEQFRNLRAAENFKTDLKTDKKICEKKNDTYKCFRNIVPERGFMRAQAVRVFNLRSQQKTVLNFSHSNTHRDEKAASYFFFALTYQELVNKNQRLWMKCVQLY